MIKKSKRLRNIPLKIISLAGANLAYSTCKRMIGKESITILMYHSIVPSVPNWNIRFSVVSTDSATFEQQMKYLKKKCTVLDSEALYRIMRGEKSPKNPVFISFDDGYRDNYLFAYPILKKYNLPAIIALTTGHIGKSELFWWDKIDYAIMNTSKTHLDVFDGYNIRTLEEKHNAIFDILQELKEFEDNKKNRFIENFLQDLKITLPSLPNVFLNWDDVREMSKNRIEFASHSVTHPIMTKLNFHEAKQQILDSTAEIEKYTGKKVRIFTYPNGSKGDISEEIDNFLEKQGFWFSMSTNYDVNYINKPVFCLNRVGVAEDDTFDIFKLKVSGLSIVLRRISDKIFGTEK